jgi:membrane-associated phospholipid phosphatase
MLHAMRGWPFGLVLWLLILGAAETYGFHEVWRFFVQTEHGQLLDYVALTGNSIGHARVESIVDRVLNGISILSLTVATVVVGFIALIRRRVALAVGAVLLIAGANVTTQVVKALMGRPELGIDPERAGVGNSLPSGHTTIAASVAVAFVLVLPAKARATGALIAAAFAAFAGVATLSAGWHRPSDAVAALLVVGGWAAAASLFIVVVQRRHGGVEYGPPSTYATVFLALISLGLLAGAGIALYLTNQALDVAVDALSRKRLFAAYAGGALGIAGTAGLMVASVLATAHRVVPQVVPPALDGDDDFDDLGGEGPTAPLAVPAATALPAAAPPPGLGHDPIGEQVTVRLTGEELTTHRLTQPPDDPTVKLPG